MIRGITLRGAVSLNVITMIGIGPLITIPLVLAQLAGPLALVGWVAGALVALCDGLVWAELGSRYPSSGGTYVYLREIFGAERWGRLLAFLFNWQFFLSASLILSTGYIGFANYAGYLFPQIAASPAINHLVALGIGVVTIGLLYRRITAVASLGIVLAVLAIGTLLLVGTAGYWHADFHRAFTLNQPQSFGLGFLAGLGGALYITLYDYLGYSQIALVGEEVHEPHRTLPRSIVSSILLVLVLYVFVQVGVLSAVPWQTLVGRNGSPAPSQAQYVASIVVANSWGAWAGRAVTILVLITAFASVYGGLLGSSRVPFAAARDGAFLPSFAKLHPTKHFPYVSLLCMGAISLIACFFDLSFVIAVIGTSSILIGSIAQIIALFVLHARGGVTPFRMWLFPLPALVALAGWILAFVNTGPLAIELGVGWLIIGLFVYLGAARAQRVWPFAAATVGALACLLMPQYARASERPAFLYGATFFYERIPRAQWAPALRAYRGMGINTIDLYVMWNWHELRDGDFDFTGRTNPRRDLVGLLHLIHDDGFRLVVRPGPVIRNEWRNGGYPAWLLVRPAYRMPLRDVLQGRYPATATLQNAHADAAAAEWMKNGVHMRYATRWLRRVLQFLVPYREDLLGVALDDDQGAYLDNDTWPGPHFHRYIRYLADVVRGTLGSGVPLFINTYEMKVPGASPVWAWGNWYQSDAYSIGEHDRAQLEFSTGLLQTQARKQIMMSEFQAGWLQGADEPAPRPADPSNTTLALHTLLQLGAHGIVNFPVQDTLNPPGWEAPWTNEFYSWDAALSVQLTPQSRYAPTARFGALIERYGTALAQTHPVADAAVAYMTSAYDPFRLNNNQIADIAQATISAQRGCRIMRITCRLVDIRYDAFSDLRAVRLLIVPRNGIALPYLSEVEQKLERFRRSGGRVVSSARSGNVAHPAAAGIPGATLLMSRSQSYAFLDIVNYDRVPLHVPRRRIRAGTFQAMLPELNVPPRDALLLPLGVNVAAQTPAATLGLDGAHASTRIPLRDGSWVSSTITGRSGVFKADPYRDGYNAVLFQTPRIRLIVSPCAGARALVFEDIVGGFNLFTTVGGFRDGWTPEIAPSSRDYIAKYTHTIPAGTFNRCYAYHIDARAASFHYRSPDAPNGGARFVKRIALTGDASFSVTNTGFIGRPARLQQLTSFVLRRGDDILPSRNGLAIFSRSRRRALLISWHDARNTVLAGHAHAALLTITYESARVQRTNYAVVAATSIQQAQAALAGFANRR